jgi:two-component system, chemotaxis family, CheB/CheR fusion protein
MTSPESGKRPLIVGIGASAGGLAAFKSFLANMPPDPGMGFVLVQHLAPDHKSLLVELLGANSPLPVITAVDGVAVKENCVYVIPPDATLTIKHGSLKLETPAPARQHRRPIDSFFVSLAEDQGECAVGIILSGVGSDGSLGIRAIKAHGGLTIAQAEFDHQALSGMPHSAAATGMVDHVMAVEAMPDKLTDYHGHMNGVAGRKDGDGMRKDIRDHLAEITALLHTAVKHDFSGYKESTLIRRLQRRMQVLQLDTIDAYIARMKSNPDEVKSLFREVLIGVTEFFRDPDAFEALKTLAIRPMLAAKRPGESVRVWVAGCSTGEEVYSIAILIKEVLGELNNTPTLDIKIFATDIDTNALSLARAGHYPKTAAGLSPERLKRWFSQDGTDVCAVPEIRELCIFSAHSVIKDPPFSKLDLISCRNLLIYFDNELQSRVTRTFHFALKSGGTLFLGPSESIGRYGNFYTVLDKKHRILARHDSGRNMPPPFQSPGALTASSPLQLEPDNSGPATTDDRIDKSVRRVMEQYAPAYFVIDRNHEILRFSGSEARHYLEPSPGTANLQLFSILHKTLRPAVRAAVQCAVADRKTVVTENLTIRIDGKTRDVTLIVEPIIESAGKDRGICVVAFRDAAPASNAPQGTTTNTTSPIATTALENELSATRFQLRAASDELEAAIEDMKSTTEEFQAVNEELQSSNEELETAKEEMQSINEELQTVNSELSSKNDETMSLNSDLKNLLDSTHIAAVFLDDDLRIRHFTPALTEIFPVRGSDRGRPITDIVNLIDYQDLKRDVDTVHNSTEILERDVSMKDKSATFLMRIRPYRTVTNEIDGVVLTFFNITERSRDDEHKYLLGKELQHRTANLFAVISSIANRTFSGDRPIEKAREAFSARLVALAKAHALLTVNLVEGASLEDVVRGELDGFSERVKIRGPSIILTPAATQGFALIIHELATNAAKYGGFANIDGKISVAWSHADLAAAGPTLAFRWQERGGPPVTPPARPGFGSKLLERAIDTSARPAVFDYATEGLTYDLNVPLTSICAPTWLAANGMSDLSKDVRDLNSNPLAASGGTNSLRD